ncbi:glycosidase [Novosphingopyxis sp.]|uniref:glycoside hydrolase family 130 protein n=1 Tax=Novosphingopyxis sp. TaxID=2709690 RepID=UPI003B5CD66D
MSFGFEVERIDAVIVDGPEELITKNIMSPFMWRADRHDAGLMALIRAVPRHRAKDEESGRIWYGRSASDGLVFRMDGTPVLVPGPHGKDSNGCEDPTVVPADEGYVVFYTGVDHSRTGHLLYATGKDMRSLEKRGVALPNGKSENDSKEATVLRRSDSWRLLYEYSHAGHSLISLVDGAHPDGPWNEQPDPFSPRPEKWDSWHLSTGPLLLTDPDRPVMFYNGANEDADWGIGWVALSPDLRTVMARCDGPLISPPTDATGPRDIAFAASVVETDGTIWLYYSRNDRELKRATIRQTG